MSESVEHPPVETPVGAATAPAASDSVPARSPRDDRRWSGLPVAMSLALVAFAVVFGIYGPRVVDRGSPAIGTPLWEAVDEIIERFDNFALNADPQGQDNVDLDFASAAVTEILGSPFTCPDLTPHEFAPLSPSSDRLPGASRAATIIYARAVRDGFEYLSLTIAPYSEQYTVFSDFGRPFLLAEGPLTTVESSPANRVHASAKVWTDTQFVYFAIGSRKTTLNDLMQPLLSALGQQSGRTKLEETRSGE